MRNLLIVNGIFILSLNVADARDPSPQPRSIEIEEGYAFGKGPNDIFRFSAENDHNLVLVEDTAGTIADNVLEITDLDPAKARVSVEFGGELNLYWSKERAGVIVQNQFLKIPGHHLGVQRIHFANGVTWTKADLETRLGINRLKLALTPAESRKPVGIMPEQRFVLGNGENDHITMHADDIGMTVLEVAANPTAQNDISIAKGLSSAQAEVFDDHGDAVISWYGKGAARLTLVRAFMSRPGAYYGVRQIRFADGAVWTLKDLVARSGPIKPGQTGGHLAGSTSGERLDTQGRTRSIIGRGGGDTIIYKRGYGDLDINEVDEGPHPSNTLALGTGITPANVTVRREGDDLALTVDKSDRSAGDKISLTAAFRRSPGEIRGVQNVVFANGQRWDFAKMVELAATPRKDNRDPEGDDGPNVFHLDENANSAVGHGGGDSFYLEVADGEVVIKESDHGNHNPNRVFLPKGVRQADVTPLRDGSDIFLEFRDQSDAPVLDTRRGVVLAGQNTPVGGTDIGVQEVVFADGSRWSATDLRRLAHAQPLERPAYDEHAAAQKEVDFKTREATANDPERFKRFIADLHAGMDRIGIDRTNRAALIAGTALGPFDPDSGPPLPARWYNVATLAGWKAGLGKLTDTLGARYVIADVLPRALCDLGPCPPPTRAQITASTLRELPGLVLPNLVLMPSARPGRVEPQPQPTHFKGPLRIASSGDPKTDEAIRKVLATLPQNSGIPLDNKSFPSSTAEANVLLYSFGKWEAFPTGAERRSEQAMRTWREHRAWLIGNVAPQANPLFTFVSNKVGSNLSRIEAQLAQSKIGNDLFLAVDGQGAAIAGACHAAPYSGEIIRCLRRIAIVSPSPDYDRYEVRSVTNRLFSSLTASISNWFHHAATFMSGILHWLWLMVTYPFRGR